MKKGRVKGIGGVFFKCKDPNAVKDWYSKNLGLHTDQYGALFEFKEAKENAEAAYLQWSPFDAESKYFEPSDREFMINYRVENLDELLTQLKQNGIKILDEIEEFEYGRFVHILGPENQKIELWEPIDESFTNSYQGKTNK
mgnify:CR=1 FL=1